MAGFLTTIAAGVAVLGAPAPALASKRERKEAPVAKKYNSRAEELADR